MAKAKKRTRKSSYDSRKALRPKVESVKALLKEEESKAAQRRFEFDKLQLQMALDTYKTLYTMMGAVIGSLIAADVALLAAGVSKRSAVICVASSFFTITIHLMRRLFERAMVPVAYVAISIEQRYGTAPETPEGLMTTFLFATSGNTKVLNDSGQVIQGNAYQYVASLVALARSSLSHQERMARLRSMPSPRLYKSRGLVIILVALTINCGAAAWIYYQNKTGVFEGEKEAVPSPANKEPAPPVDVTRGTVAPSPPPISKEPTPQARGIKRAKGDEVGA